MRRTLMSDSRRGPTKYRTKVTTTVMLAGVALCCLVGAQVVDLPEVAAAVTQAGTGTGFTQPFSGTPEYQHLAPIQITNTDQLNQPIGRLVADKIARQLGLTEADTFTNQQYLEFITGKGVKGDPAAAKLVDESVRIFTNTTGRPLYSNVNGEIKQSVLASYGLFVNTSGSLESLANLDAPTRKANSIIAPGGYLGTWCRANGATKSLTALYKSAYTLEAVYGNKSQKISSNAQLVANHLGGVSSEVGMSMVPSIWFVNFLLLYLLNPAVAADMPAKWAPIPSTVADAILASPTGQVPYAAYESDLG